MLVLPLLFLSLLTSCALQSAGSPNGLNPKSPVNSYFLSFQTGEVFDSSGSLAYKFPGGYPLLVDNGKSYFVFQDETIYKYRNNGDLIYRTDFPLTHDWDVNEKSELFFLSRTWEKMDRRTLRSAEIRVLDPNGKGLRKFNFFQQKHSLEKDLGVGLEPHFFSSAKVIEVFGKRLTCNCWEFEHFNFINVLKKDFESLPSLPFKKGNLLTSFPLHQYVVIMNPQSFQILWKMKLPGVHFFHTPVLTPWSTLLVFVNNFRDEDQVIERSAIVEYDLKMQKEIWRYELPPNMYSPLNGSVEGLADGRILFSVMTGETFYLENRKTLKVALDLRPKYLAQGVDFYRLNEFAEGDLHKLQNIK